MSSVLRKKCVRLYETGKNVLMHAKVVLMQQERHGGSFELGGQTSKKVVFLRGELFSPKVKTACVEAGGLFFSCRFCVKDAASAKVSARASIQNRQIPTESSKNIDKFELAIAALEVTTQDLFKIS